MSAVAYQRVSTAHQAEDGQSLENQQRKIRGHCDQYDLTLSATYTDAGVSGGLRLRDRPEGSKMLAAVQKGDVVVAASLCRCHRSASDALATFEDLKRRGVGLVLLDLGPGEVTSGGISGLLYTIIAAVATFERSVIKERISSVKSMQRSRGLYLGGRRPIGHQIKDGKLVADPAEQAAMSLVLRLSVQGMSLRKCQAAVHEALGLKISHTAIRRILREARVNGRVA